MTQTMQSCFMLLVRSHKPNISNFLQKQNTIDIPELQLISYDNNSNVKLVKDKAESLNLQETQKEHMVDLNQKVYFCNCTC